MVLIAHNGFSFDFVHLMRCLALEDIPIPDWLKYGFDTLKTLRAYPPAKKDIYGGDIEGKSLKLGDLYQKLSGKTLQNAHDALVDVKANLFLLEKSSVLWKKRTNVQGIISLHKLKKVKKKIPFFCNKRVLGRSNTH